MTACYGKAGLRFLYPENWKIAEEQITDMPLSLTVESPGGGFWVIMVYDAEIDPALLVEQVVDSMCDEYEGMEISPIAHQFGDAEAEGFDMLFYCLDFVVHSRVLAVRALEKSMLTMWQAEDREFESLEPVFRAMTTSLLEPKRTGQPDRTK
ncbi:MAG: hypothetical protein ACC645_03670 [Pirellulales bacterium]